VLDYRDYEAFASFFCFWGLKRFKSSCRILQTFHNIQKHFLFGSILSSLVHRDWIVASFDLPKLRNANGQISVSLINIIEW